MLDIIYYGTHVLGMITGALYLFFYSEKYGLNKLKTIVGVICVYAIGYALMLTSFSLINGYFGGKNIIRLFPFIPLLVFVISKLLKIDTERFMGVVTPIPCIIQGIAKIGCQFEGCCKSWLKVPWGIYNQFEDTRLFPIQLTESVVSVLIAAIFIFWAKKKKYAPSPYYMPSMLMLFGSTRFFLELLRKNEKVLWNISSLSTWAVLMTVEGLVWIIIAYVIQKKKKSAG